MSEWRRYVGRRLPFWRTYYYPSIPVAVEVTEEEDFARQRKRPIALLFQTWSLLTSIKRAIPKMMSASWFQTVPDFGAIASALRVCSDNRVACLGPGVFPFESFESCSNHVIDAMSSTVARVCAQNEAKVPSCAIGCSRSCSEVWTMPAGYL